MFKISLSAILVILALQPISAESQSVFRLFTTPAERAELERRRQELFRPGQVSILPEPAEDPLFNLPVVEEDEPEDIIYRLGGTMLRSDGSYTVWINGLPINQENLPENFELLEPFTQGRLRIISPDNGRSFEVKPGQVLNLTTGELFESYDFVEPPPRAEADGSVTEPEAGPDSLD
jgi:hypothetical protein